MHLHELDSLRLPQSWPASLAQQEASWRKVLDAAGMELAISRLAVMVVLVDLLPDCFPCF